MYKRQLKFFKVNAEVPDTPEDPADGCLIHQELGLAYDKYDVKGLPTCVTHRYVVTKTYSDGKATSKVLAGVKIDGETISFDKDGANAVSYTHLDVYKRQIISRRRYFSCTICM